MSARGEGKLRGEGGTELYFHWLRPAEPRAVIAVVHGLGEHCGRYQWLAEALVEGRFAYYGYDQRGHGKSEGAHGDIRRFRDYTRDLEAFVREVHGREKPRPIFLLGHSLGGVVAVLYALDHQAELAGLVAASTAFELVAPPHRLSLAGSRLLSAFAPGVRVGNDLDPAALSSDPKVVADYVADPLVQRTVTLRWTNEFFSTHRQAIERAGELSLPLLVLQGEADRIASTAGARAFFERAGSADKMLHVYPEFRHELFNESPPKRARVFADLLSWLNKHVEVI